MAKIRDWATILTPDQIEAHWQDMAAHWPSMAKRSRDWWESRTLPELHGRLSGAWRANELDSYVIARSYISSRKAAERGEA